MGRRETACAVTRVSAFLWKVMRQGSCHCPTSEATMRHRCEAEVPVRIGPRRSELGPCSWSPECCEESRVNGTVRIGPHISSPIDVIEGESLEEVDAEIGNMRTDADRQPQATSFRNW